MTIDIAIDNVTRRFGGFTAVDGVDLEIAAGELVALLGPSGSGKTTLLRMIAGLEYPDDGRILFDGRDATLRPAKERRVGFVFQHYALFRHMTVFANVEFGLRIMPRSKRPSAAERRERVTKLLELVQLAPFADRYPSQLSGGQRQRVALARALAIEPRVLLLDEPFGALDATVRKELRRWLRRLHDEIKVTSVFVTHDQDEAMEVADRVVVMNRGRIEQAGSPAALHDAPASPFVYEFLGHANRFPCRIADGVVEVGDMRFGAHEAGLGETEATAAGEGIAFVRPHDLELHPAESSGAAARLPIRHIVARGGMLRVELADTAAGGPVYEAEVARRPFETAGWRIGARAALRPKALRVFREGAAG